MATEPIAAAGDVRPAASSDASRWRRQHPEAFVLGCFVIFEAVHLAIAWNDAAVVRTLAPWVPDGWLAPFIWGGYALLALGMVAALGWWREVGLARLGSLETVGLLVYPFATGLVFLALGINLDSAQVIPIALVGTPLIAINEEVFFRGIALEGLRPQGWRSAVIGSAFLFGFAHTINVVSGANLPFTVMQVAATTAGGITLAAIRIRSGSLWPVIALHIGLDLVALSTLTGDGVDSPILLPVLFAWLALNLSLWWYGWRLLRGRSDADLDVLYTASREGRAT